MASRLKRNRGAFTMRLSRFFIIFTFILALAFAQSSVGTEGGNISGVNTSINQSTGFWAAIVGDLNGSDANLSEPISNQSTPNTTVYYNEPNGSYSDLFNYSMVLTRLDYKPNLSDIYTPVPSDFNESGMFSNFTLFSGIDFSLYPDDPFDTFVSGWSVMTCYLYDIPFLCPYITLNPNTAMAILKFDNGTHVEPLFVGVINNTLGYNLTSLFDFQYMVPALEFYNFYSYKPTPCNITVWIDGVQTTTFPRTATPYDVRLRVTDNAAPVTGVRVYAVEENGRNFLSPLLELGRTALGDGIAWTDSDGRAVFVLSPTRYNIPDSFGYQPYLEVRGFDGYSCRTNLSIASYGSLQPTYRTALVNNSYSSQVKASAQNMNALASTASKWVSAGKMRKVDVTVYTNGTYSALPTLKAGAPNLLNITVYNHTTLAPINASASILEQNGSIIFVPGQPQKDGYDAAKGYNTSQAHLIIPTRYNNNANLSLTLGEEGVPFAVLYFTVDTILEPPSPAETDIDSATYSAISSALQNINSVLMNIAKSLSTV
jgi:hypothetical protein